LIFSYLVNEAIYEVLTLHLIFSYRDILLVLVSTISEKAL